ncbi:hypothetical protein L6R49_24175 [Myxococcota bacterium]|nr:hypothetical protein [Myxococcota bacterium]
MSALYAEVQGHLDDGRPDLAWRAAEAGLGSGALRERALARRLLMDLAPLLPQAAWTDAHKALAERLLITHRPGPLGPGVARFPAVSGGAGRLITVTVTKTSAPQDSLPVGREALRPAFDAARAFLNDPNLRFSARFEPEEGWEGASAGLALALAAVGAARLTLDLSLVVATGKISASGAVMTVGHFAEKQRLCREAAPRATLLLPQAAGLGQVLGTAPVGTLTEALEWLGRADDPDEHLDAVRRLDRAGRWEEAAKRAERLLHEPDLSPHHRAELIVVCVAAANHSADDTRGAELAARLTASLRVLDGVALAQAIGHLAVRAIDTFDPRRAAEVLALAPLSDVKEQHHVHLLGPNALLHTLRGEHEAALSLRRLALHRASSDERPRALGDLADALLRVGDAEGALTTAEEALNSANLVKMRRDYQERTRIFLRLHHARALAACLRRDEALAAVAPVCELHGLDPALRGKLLSAELTGRLTAAQALHQRYAPFGGIIRALTLRTLARLGDAQAAAELLALPLFAGLTVEEAGRRLPY